ncbi:hypothetical protein KIPB_013133, partial [Kipferlia bialata]
REAGEGDETPSRGVHLSPSVPLPSLPDLTSAGANIDVIKDACPYIDALIEADGDVDIDTEKERQATDLVAELKADLLATEVGHLPMSEHGALVTMSRRLKQLDTDEEPQRGVTQRGRAFESAALNDAQRVAEYVDDDQSEYS